ncbi:MAG: hypothetical protein QOD86_439 [Miltoncostaeaceae bacterium]|nr:hypothetical protein [Miltoncostaeaceae bacterium]
MRPLLVAYRALGLGDLLTAVPALRALARAFPEHRRVLAAPVALEPLALLIGAVDEVAGTGDGKRAPPPLPARLRGAVVVVNLHGRGPASHARIRESGARRVIAFADPAASVPGGPAWDEPEHEVRRWCRMLSEHGIPADPGDLDLVPPPWPVPAGAAGAVLVHPGAAEEARRWPAQRWAAVARAIDAPVAVTGDGSERRLAEEVSGGEWPVLAGRTDLRGLAAAVSAARLVICGDTGVAHLATAFGTPSVVLFGPTDPAVWGPPPDRARRHHAIWKGETGNPHGSNPDPGLLEIGVPEVLARVGLLVKVNPMDTIQEVPKMSVTDKLTGRVKKAAGDLLDNPSLRREGSKEERKGEAKEELDRAQDKTARKAQEVADLERRT